MQTQKIATGKSVGAKTLRKVITVELQSKNHILVKIFGKRLDFTKER